MPLVEFIYFIGHALKGFHAYFFILFTLRGIEGYQDRIPLNPNSTIFKDIDSIAFDNATNEIIIALGLWRKCDKPTFLVRLSGKALYKLELERHDHRNRKPIPLAKTKEFFFPRESIYHYKVPPILDTGLYFVEVVVLLCTTFDPNSFKDVCLEEVQDGLNIVNLDYSMKLSASSARAQSSTQSSVNNDTALSSRWVLLDDANTKMLRTRYQHRKCDHNQYCEPNREEVAQHLQYEWVDAPDWKVAWKQVISRHKESTKLGVKETKTYVTVCFVGDSHAREISTHFPKIDNGLVLPIFIEAKYPHTFNVAALAQHQCTYAVVAFGQWLVSYSEDVPYTAKQYTTAMTTMMQQVSAPTYNGTTKTFFCSINYNALGAYITTCPPFDHRSPPVIDMLNQVLINLCKKFKFDFIDMNKIMGPMWDSALDYCHPRGKVFIAEGEWILHHLFASTLTRGEEIAMNEVKNPVEGTIMRFSDDKVLYLCRNGSLHAFPNGQTFASMGFDFGNVRVELSAKRGHYVVGDDLPSL